MSGSVVSESDVSGRDDVSSDVIIEVNDFESKVEKSTDDNDDDLTQLENRKLLRCHGFETIQNLVDVDILIVKLK